MGKEQRDAIDKAVAAYDADHEAAQEYGTHLRRHIEGMLDLMADPISPESASAFAALANVWYTHARHYGRMAPSVIQENEGESDERSETSGDESG